MKFTNTRKECRTLELFPLAKPSTYAHDGPDRSDRQPVEPTDIENAPRSVPTSTPDPSKRVLALVFFRSNLPLYSVAASVGGRRAASSCFCSGIFLPGPVHSATAGQGHCVNSLRPLARADNGAMQLARPQRFVLRVGSYAGIDHSTIEAGRLIGGVDSDGVFLDTGSTESLPTLPTAMISVS